MAEQTERLETLQAFIQNLGGANCPTLDLGLGLNLYFQPPTNTELQDKNVTESIESITGLQSTMMKIISYYIDQYTDIIKRINQVFLTENPNGYQPPMNSTNYKITIGRFEKNIKNLETMLKHLQQESTEFISVTNEYQQILTEYITIMEQIKITLTEIDNKSSIIRQGDKSGAYSALNRDFKRGFKLKQELKEAVTSIRDMVRLIKYQYKNYIENKIIFDIYNSKLYINIKTEEKVLDSQFASLRDDKIFITNKLLLGNKSEIAEKLKHINMDSLTLPTIADLQIDLSSVDMAVTRSRTAYLQQLENITQQDDRYKIQRINLPKIPEPTLMPIGMVVPVDLDKHSIKRETCCQPISQFLNQNLQKIYITVNNEITDVTYLIQQNLQSILQPQLNYAKEKSANYLALNLENIGLIKSVETRANISPEFPQNILITENNENEIVFKSTYNKNFIAMPYVLYMALHLTKAVSENYSRFVLLLNHQEKSKLNTNMIFYCAICLIIMQNYLQKENDGENMVVLFNLLNRYLERNATKLDISQIVNEILKNSTTLCRSIIETSDLLFPNQPQNTILQLAATNNTLPQICTDDGIFWMIYSKMIQNQICIEHDFTLLILRTLYLLTLFIDDTKLAIVQQINKELPRDEIERILNKELRNFILYQKTFLYNRLHYRDARDIVHNTPERASIKKKLFYGMPDFYITNNIEDIINLTIFYFFENLGNYKITFNDLCVFYKNIYNDNTNILINKLYNQSLIKDNNFTLNLIQNRMDIYRTKFLLSHYYIFTKPQIDTYNDWTSFNMNLLSDDRFIITDYLNAMTTKFVYKEQKIYRL